MPSDERDWHIRTFLDLGLSKSSFPIQHLCLIEMPSQGIVYLTLFFGKIMNFGPVIIPKVQLNRFHLFGEASILLDLKRYECQVRRTLDYRLAFAQE